MVKAIPRNSLKHAEMTDPKWVRVVCFLVLLSFGVCSSSRTDLPAAKEEEKYKPESPVGFNGGDEGKWSWDGSGGYGSGGGVGGGSAGGSIGGDISGGIPGFGIGGGIGGGTDGANGGISGGGSIVVPGFGGEIHGGVSGGTGDDVISDGIGHCDGTRCGSNSCPGSGGCNNRGNGSGGKGGSGVVMPGWLGQPLHCTPITCPKEHGGACGGIKLHFSLAPVSYDGSTNGTESNV